jgi:hypothetical protein
MRTFIIAIFGFAVLLAFTYAAPIKENVSPSILYRLKITDSAIER